MVDQRHFGHTGRVMHFFHPALLVIYEIRHVGYGRNHIHIELAIQTFLHDFHVKQAEETATETEAQRHGRFRLEGQRRIVQLQFFQRGPEIFKILGLYGIKPGKNHRLDFLETGNGFIARTLHVSNRIADFHLRCRLNTGNDIPHIPAMQFLTGGHFHLQYSNLISRVFLARIDKSHFVARLDTAVHDFEISDNPTERVEHGIEYQCLQRSVLIPFRMGDTFHHSL